MKPRQTRTDQLTAHIPAIEIRSGTFVAFRPFRGWWLCNIDLPRHFGDDGDYLGANWREAEAALKWLYAKAAAR
jgi:hypothetical protein